MNGTQKEICKCGGTEKAHEKDYCWHVVNGEWCRCKKFQPKQPPTPHDDELTVDEVYGMMLDQPTEEQCKEVLRLWKVKIQTEAKDEALKKAIERIKEKRRKVSLGCDVDKSLRVGTIVGLDFARFELEAEIFNLGQELNRRKGVDTNGE